MKKRSLGIAIVLLLVFSFTIFFLTRFNKSTIIARDGFFVTGNEIDEVLLNENKIAKTGNVELEKVTKNDTFYSNLDKVFIGEEKKTEVNTVYPLFVNNGLGVVNIDVRSKLINKKFEYFDSYENFTITGGKLYNFGDFEQADYENYILLQLANGTYVNVLDINLDLMNGTHTIPLNSIVNFQENYINYYYYNNKGKLVYKIIDGIDSKSIISFGDYKYTYENVLIKLGIIEEKEEPTTEVVEEAEEEEYIIEDNSSSSSSTESGEKKYIAPKVSVTEFTPNVYSAKARLSVSDPSRVIVGGVNFQFFVNDKVFLRKTFVSGGNIEVIGLVPNTKFKIVGNYKYYNEESKKMEITFFEQELSTFGVENLEPISLSFQNGEVYPNKIVLNNLSITSDLKSETIKGVNKGIIIINGEQFSIPTSGLNELMAGREITYTSPAKIESNANINYEIRLLDAYNNDIKVTNNTGSTRTSKNAPTATVRITDSAVNSVSFATTLKNPDDVNITGYRYMITDSNGYVFKEDDLNKNSTTDVVTLKDLDPNATYNITILGNFDIEDGQGALRNQILGEGKFTTSPLSSLGFFRVTATPKNLTDESVTISSNMDVFNVSGILMDLLNTLTVTVTDENDNVITTKTYQGDELNDIRAGENFDIDIDGLSSVTTYNVNYTSTVKQGTVKESVTVLCSLKNFTTYKKNAEVQIRNKFVTANMIDFDVRVVDLDGAIESGRVLLEIRDSRNNLVGKEYLDINADYIQLSYTKLDQDETYSFKYIAEEYNIGSSNSTYVGDYILLEEDIVTEDGISGTIELTDLLRDITGTNLFNIEDFDRIRKEGNIGYKEYDISNNTVMFGAKNGYVNYSYFLPEGKGKAVVVKFKARYNKDSPNRAPVYISRGSSNGLHYEVVDLDNEWKDYTFNVTMNTNYIGFVINETSNQNNKTTVDFKDIQIIYNELSEENDDVDLSHHISGYVFSDPVMLAGDKSMPNWRSSGNVVGNYGEGHARITSLSNSRVYEFTYTGAEQVFEVPTNGKYKIELWGAAGGDNSNPVGSRQNYGSHSGLGAYTSGTIELTRGTKLYVYVGEAGKYGSGTNPYGGKPATFNGGGAGGNSGSGSGGGATDVRLTNGNWRNLESLQSRIMVAAGGGGADNWGGTLHGSDDGSGGPGGDISSIGAYINGVISPEFRASQSYGFAFGYGESMGRSTDCGGGGGGYFGGYTSDNNNGGAAGGSSYISGYKGCVAYHNFIEDKYFDYTENSQLQGTFKIGIKDVRDEITTKDWYVRIYRKGTYVTEYKYDLTDSIMEDVEKTYGFDKNVNYTVALSVKIRDRYYDLDTVEFGTESEIRGIRTTSDFLGMHPNGKYIVLNDLNFSGVGSSYGSWFYGEIDFQGHHVERHAANGNAGSLITHFRAGAVMKNLVLDFYGDNTSSRSWWYGIITYHYGTIDNLMINVKEGLSQPNYVYTPGVYANYGTIKNFVVNAEAPISGIAANGYIAWTNQGVLRNGYVYGQNIYAYHQNINSRDRKDVGGFSGVTENNSRIEAVYSLVSVEKSNSYGTGNREAVVGNMVGYSAAGYLGNAYSVELPDQTNTNIITQDPNVGLVGGMRYDNLYYVSDRVYGGKYSSKISKLALYDKNFQNDTLNIYDGFDVDKLVDLGYFPQVKLNDCMPKQEWIELPKVTDADLIDVTSVEELENYGDSALVKLHINNPSNEEIKRVTITDINKVEIINQKNTFGKTELTIKLSEPRAYKSRYYVDTLWMKPAYGVDYSKTYEKNERAINIDLYYPIHSKNDWKVMVSNPAQNYALFEDIKFNDGAISPYIVNGTFTGKFDGRGHKISNITIDSTNALFNSVSGGTIKNLFVENYTKTNKTAYGGLVYSSTNNATFDNVHITNAKVHGRERIAALVGSAVRTTFRNCSVTGFVPILYKDTNGNTLEAATYEFDNIYVGPFAGYAESTFIENCYAQDSNIVVDEVLSTFGVGGLVGRMNLGTINNSYATGKIKCNSVNVGGLVGWSNATISNVWSYVDITTELDYVGGIVGKSDNNNVSNTMVFGAVYSSYVSNEGNNIHRTTGNVLPTVQSNYAWDRQKFYGWLDGQSSAEILLSTEMLEEESSYIDLVGFGDSFDLSSIGDHIVPKIKNSDTMELLPNQKDIKLTSELFDVREKPSATKTSTEGDIHIVIENPNQYEITGVEFDYLDIVSARYSNYAYDGSTIIDVHVKPNKYFDSYIFNKVKYIDENGNPQEYEKVVKVELQFFRTLDRYEVWQQISDKHAENYRLTADIDFTGKANINTEVLFGRLEGQVSYDEENNTLTNEQKIEQNHVIKNFSRTSFANKTGLIKKITTTLKNVTFENINFETDKSYNYINVIYLNYADITNVAFKNITINTPKSGYVGPIGYHRGQNIKNVLVEGNHITGTRNVAGFISYMYNTSTRDIVGRDCVIYGNNTMIGGLIGEKPYINAYNSYEYYGYNMNVTGKTYVGGLFGQGGAYGAYLYDSEVHALAGGSMIGGISGYDNYENDRQHLVSGSLIEGTAEKMGGLHGRALHFRDGTVVNSRIIQTDASKTYVGGADGFQDGYTHTDIAVVDTLVESAGDYVGGISGRINSGAVLQYSFTNNVTVNGRNYVGGVAGSCTTFRLYRHITNAKVTATGNYAGGGFGYLSSVHATDNSYSGIDYEHLIVNTEVTGNNNVGGYVGKTNSMQLTPAKFYNIVIVANVTSKVNVDVYAGIINGDDNRVYATTQLTTFRVYENSKVNNKTLLNEKPNYLNSNYIVNSTTLKTASFYTNFGFATSRFDNSRLSNGYFPQVKRDSGSTIKEQQKLITIPNAGVTFSARMTKVAPIDHELPKLDVYASGINTINLEFSDKDDYSFFEVYDSGVKVFDSNIDDRAFTVNYDYQSKIKVVVSDGRNSKTYTYSPGELRNLTTTYGKKYAYIYGGKLKGNIDDIKSKGKFIHIYKNLALTDEVEVFDITTGEQIENGLIFTVSLQDEATPLFSFDYKNSKIDTYYNYSIIDNGGDDINYDNQLFVKNGKVEIIDSMLDSYHNMIIVDSYSKNDYVTTLGKDGMIYNLKSNISMPSNFSNKSILSMSNNIESDNSAVILIYKSGKVVIFDYRTGRELVLEKATEDISIFDYFRENFNPAEPIISNNITNSYQEALNLKELLKDNPIESNGSGGYTKVEIDEAEDTSTPSPEVDRNYVTYYNYVRDDYDVLDVSQLLNTEDTISIDEDVITENNKIYTSNSLVQFYMKESIFTEVFKNINGLYIFGTLLFGILTALGLWLRNAKLLRSVEEVNNDKN